MQPNLSAGNIKSDVIRDSVLGEPVLALKRRQSGLGCCWACTHALSRRIAPRPLAILPCCACCAACRGLGGPGIVAMVEQQAYRASLPFMSATQGKLLTNPAGLGPGLPGPGPGARKGLCCMAVMSRAGRRQLQLAGCMCASTDCYSSAVPPAPTVLQPARRCTASPSTPARPSGL